MRKKKLQLVIFIGFCSAVILWSFIGTSNKQNLQDDLAEDVATSSQKELNQASQVKPASREQTVELVANSPSEESNVFDSYPYDLYKKHISLADSGDSHAQYIVSESIALCSEHSSRNVEQLEKLSLHPLMFEAFMNELREYYQECAGLYRELKDVDLDELRLAWLVSSASEGHSVAKLELMFEHPNHPSADEVLPVLYSAFVLSEGDDLLRKNTIEAAFRFYARYIEAPRLKDYEIELGYNRGGDRAAWEYLECQHSGLCDMKEFLGHMETKYYEYEIDTMVSRAKEITEAIASHDWSNIGFEPGKN